MRATRSQRTVAVAFIAALGLAVILALRTIVPDTIDVPFGFSDAFVKGTAVELSYDGLPTQPGPHQARALLYVDAAAAIAAHDSIQLLTATYETAPRLVKAWIEISSSCRFESAPGAPLLNNGTLLLHRTEGCVSDAVVKAARALTLVCEFTGPGRVAVWATVPSPQRLPEESPPRAIIHISAMNSELLPERPLLRGRFIDRGGGPGARRIDLLAYVWQVSPRSGWIIGILSGAFLMVGCGALLLPVGQVGSEPSTGVALRASAASALAAASLGLLYAVLVPPFQAADEPAHFVSYAHVTRSEYLLDQAPQWAAKTHFERIRFFSQEHFQPSDRGKPMRVAWTGMDPPPYEPERSSVMLRLWPLVHRVTGDMAAPKLFLTLRLLNVAFFATAIGLAVWVVTASGGPPWRHLFGLTLIIVPTLPFFGMHLSNHAILVSAYCGIAGAVVTLLLDGPRTYFAGPLLGASAGLALVASRSAGPLLPLLAAIGVGRVLLGTRREQGMAVVEAIFFWGGLWLAFLIPDQLLGPEYRMYVGGMLDQVFPIVGAPTLHFVFLHERLMVFMAALGGVIAETYFSILREQIPHAVKTRFVRAGKVAATLVCGGLAAVAAVSLFWKLPLLERVTVTGPVPLSTYLWHVTRSALTLTRLRNLDFSVSGSFWTGFGWLDVPVPDVVSLSLSAVTGGLLGWLFYSTARDGDARRLCWLLCLLVGAFVTLELYAATIVRHSPDFHGRYVLGLYLTVVAMAWSVWLVEGRLRARAALLTGAVALLHGTSFVCILARYF